MRDQVRGRFVRLVAIDGVRVERNGPQVQQTAAELARQLEEPGQAHLIRTEADFWPAVVLGDGGHDRQVLPGREPGRQAASSARSSMPGTVAAGADISRLADGRPAQDACDNVSTP